MSFERAFMETALAEGGYVNDPQDKGGETYKGIARKMHPDWKGWPLVDLIKRINGDFESNQNLQDAVKDFYRAEFWEKLRCDEIDQISEVVAEELFEAAVNCGPANGVRFLQRALNRCNVNGTLYADITEDGIIGKGTIGAVKKCLEKPVAVKLLCRCQNGEQYIYYTKLSQHERYRGWFART